MALFDVFRLSGCKPRENFAHLLLIAPRQVENCWLSFWQDKLSLKFGRKITLNDEMYNTY